MKYATLMFCFLMAVLLKPGTAEARILHDGLQNPKFIISNGSLQVNNAKFGAPWKINPFLKAVGGNYSTKKLFHKVHTFNDKGIHVYEYIHFEEANEVQLSFVRQNLQFAPKSTFSGTFKIESTAITRKTSIQNVIKSLPDYHFTKGDQGNFFRGEHKGIYIYLNYSDKSFKIIDFISFGTKKLPQ